MCSICVWVQNQETGKTGKKCANIKILPLCCQRNVNLISEMKKSNSLAQIYAAVTGKKI